MGSRFSSRSKRASRNDKPGSTKGVQENTRARVLCLHGWRTSGDILAMQMAAMQGNTSLDCTFVTAPHAATGPPDPGIEMFYPDYAYFEWFLREECVEAEGGSGKRVERIKGMEESMEMLIKMLHEASPRFDGILGFSQGAGMATRLAHWQQQQPPGTPALFDFVILVGGVPPLEREADIGVGGLSLPSLHIQGKTDSLLPMAERLAALYSHTSKTVLQHAEGHNIPSIRTGVYPQIDAFLSSHS
jgi:predicted esterase